MKVYRVLLLAAVALFAFSPVSSVAQNGIYWPAATLEEEQLVVGSTLGFGSFPTFFWIGQARYGINDQVDMSPKVGFARESGVTAFVIGGDFRYGYLQERNLDDFDLSFVGLFNLWHGNSQTIYNAGAGAMIGRTMPMEGSDIIFSPYGGIMLGVSHVPNNNDFGGMLPIGNQFTINDNLVAHFELDVMFGADTEVQVGLGVNYLY